MNRNLAITPEQIYEARVRMFYKTNLRCGLDPEQALERAKNSVAFFAGAIAIMEASEWKADPIALARNQYATPTRI